MGKQKPNKTKQNILKQLKSAIAASHPQYEMVHVVWHDASMVAGVWTPSNLVLEDGQEARLIHTCGFLIEDTKAHILVSLSVDPSADMYDMVLKVPRENIRKIKKLHTITL